MNTIADLYSTGLRSGWVGRDEAARHYEELRAEGEFPEFRGAGAPAPGPRKAMLYTLARKALGRDVPNVPQQIGDCVSHGAKHAVEYLTCAEIVGAAARAEAAGEATFATSIAARRPQWRPVFAPYFYGTGRVYVGGNRMGNTDGSSGAWMAAAVRRYGTLFEDEPGVPPYSGAVAKQWGMSPAPLDRWQPTARAYPVRTTTLIRSWDDLVAAVANGYPCTTASDVGYAMLPGADGFHAQTDTWAHQMCFIGVDETHPEPYAVILNNWGDLHGRLKDFQTGEDLPVGVLRVRRADAEKHLAAGETYAYSQFDGFPDQASTLNRAGFILV